MDTTEARPCERLCPRCQLWKHHSRFKQFRHPATSIEVARVSFSRFCKDCEQIERNERLNADRPRAILERRAANHARELGVSKRFLWINMNWAGLVPVLRAMLGPEGRCLSCGHPFLNERDVQVEHREPPRHAQDWARQHARNLGLVCQSCNGTKSNKSYAVWLDEQEGARLSNETHRTQEHLAPVAVPLQLSLDHEGLGP